MLKQWHQPEALLTEITPEDNTSTLDSDCQSSAFSDSDGTSPYIPGPTEETWRDAYIDPSLSPKQRRDLEDLLREFSDVLTSNPGYTTYTTHFIQTGDAPPTRSRPHRIPQARQDEVQDKLQRMLNAGIFIHQIASGRPQLYWLISRMAHFVFV